MALDPNVDALLVPVLHEKLGDMVWGSRYGQVFSLFNKRDSGATNTVAVAVDVNFGGGGGATYSDAYDNSSLVLRKQFDVTPFKLYGISKVPLWQNELTKGPESAAVLLIDESQKAIDMAKNQMDVVLSSDGYGTLGTIVTPTNTSGSTWTVTFALGSEIRHFWPGMVVTQKDTPTGTLQAGTGLITNVNPGQKKLTLTASGGFTPTAGYAMGQSGSQASGTAFTAFPGIPAWIPPAANRPVSNALFFGVDRSVSEQKLAGSYLDGTKLTVLEGVLQLDAQIANVPGAMCDTIICSTTTKAKIVSDAQTQKRYMETREVSSPDGTYFFKTISVQCVSGMLDILESSNWPDNQVYVGDRGDLFLASPGNKPIKPVNSNGSPIVEIPDDDACAVRFRAQGFVYPNNPGFHGMLTVKA